MTRIHVKKSQCQVGVTLYSLIRQSMNSRTPLGHLAKILIHGGDGGYIIWAGSATSEGAYSYREGFGPEIGFNELPFALLERLTAKDGRAAIEVCRTAKK